MLVAPEAKRRLGMTNYNSCKPQLLTGVSSPEDHDLRDAEAIMAHAKLHPCRPQVQTAR